MDQDDQKDYDNPSTELERELPKDIPYDAVYQQPKKSAQSNMALASLVMGIIGIVTSCCGFGGLIFGSLGILFALLSRTEDRFEGYAKAGLITSAVALVLVVLVAILFFGFVFMEGLQSGGVF